MRYRKGGDIHVLAPYEKYEHAIRVREDTHRAAGERDILGEDDKLKRREVCNHFPERENDISALSSDGQRLQENYEVCQSEGTGHDCLSGSGISVKRDEIQSLHLKG